MSWVAAFRVAKGRLSSALACGKGRHPEKYAIRTTQYEIHNTNDEERTTDDESKGGDYSGPAAAGGRL